MFHLPKTSCLHAGPSRTSEVEVTLTYSVVVVKDCKKEKHLVKRKWFSFLACRITKIFKFKACTRVIFSLQIFHPESPCTETPRGV